MNSDKIAQQMETVTITSTNDNNKCVSRLARRKSHHMALVNATAPNSDCPTKPHAQF